MVTAWDTPVTRPGSDGATMRPTHVHVSRPRIPEGCRRTPNASRDGTFGIFICNVREGQCFFRGPIFVQDVNGRRFECRKVETPDSDETPTQ
jgi:hypothetical protein